MNKLMKTGIASLALTAAFVSKAEVELETAPYEDAVGWTPFALSLASPVQLPWGIGDWDVFGVDLGLVYNDVAKMYGLGIGLANTARDTTRGLVLGGLFNYCGSDVYGIRAALGANICTRTLRGMDIGGFGYHAVTRGIDLELVGTMHEEITGFAGSLIFNHAASESYGCALAGAVNIAPVAYGAQLAAVFNMTDELHGFQLALVNYAKTCPWGFQVGLVNIIMDNQIPVLPIINGYF